MSKRSYDQDDSSRPPKRPKPDHVQPPTVQTIDYARQLQDLLAFSQDGIAHLRGGIASFRVFLETILYRKDEDNRGRSLSILREYLESQRPADVKDPERPFLSQLWQAWSFAVQNHNDHVVSSVAAILALLLKTLSTLIDFREYGILLCRTVLLHQHLRLIKRGLDAPKQKDFVLSPCLRLLTETTTFDGGVFAKEVYKRREHTFDIATTRRNLGLIKQDVPEEELRRRPPIRTLTVRYVLALLKYLHEGAVADILKSRPLCAALFNSLRYDSPESVKEILTATQLYVLKIKDIQRSAKATLLTQNNLERVTEIAVKSHDEHTAAESAFAWLSNVVTNPDHGILRSSAWYPPGSTTLETGLKEDMIDLGLDSIDFYDNSERPNMRNTTLLGWIQTLRPHADLKERELVLTCLRSAPELIAAYFSDKNMQMDPKLTNTWIGYASFIFEVVCLPEPEHLGNVEGDQFAELPPQTHIMVENILPRPWTQKILTKCLNQNCGLITFFAVRVLIVALQKLQRVSVTMERAAEQPQCRTDLWSEARSRLVRLVAARCPIMKDVISTFRKTPANEDSIVQREAISRLLSLYYQLLDVTAGEEAFDISSALTTALETTSRGDQISMLRSLDLEHLLSIAGSTTGMRWFTKQGSLLHSPMVSILKIHSVDPSRETMRTLISRVLELYSMAGSRESTDALIASLINVEPDSDIWEFLDECMSRASRAPVKYLDDLDDTQPGEKDRKDSDRHPSLIAAVVVEQLPFASSRPEVVKWAHSYLAILGHVGNHSRNLKTGKAKAIKATEQPISFAHIQKLLRQVRIPHAEHENDPAQEATLADEDSLQFSPPAQETENHPELLRWARKDLGLAIEEGDVGALMLCLSSRHEDIRRQALAQLKLLRTALQVSSLDDKDGLSLLVGELTETYEQTHVQTPLSYLATTFAARSLHVLLDPTHHMYPKLNRFLIRSPNWQVSRLPSYWFANTAMVQPSEDDAYWKEVQWTLEWLVDGLRIEDDLNVLRKGDILQKTMALHDSPAASTRLVKERTYELLFRATYIESGSNTLITRTGVLAWLGMRSTSQSPIARALRKHILATCGAERVQSWSSLDIASM